MIQNVFLVDLDGNKLLDEEEIEALFQKEVSTMFFYIEHNTGFYATFWINFSAYNYICFQLYFNIFNMIIKN